jgi:Peptidoglycan-binding protein, CsiV
MATAPSSAAAGYNAAMKRILLAFLALGLDIVAQAQQPVVPAVATPAAAAAASVTPKGPSQYTVEVVIFRSTSAASTAASAEDLTAQSSRSLSGDSDSAGAAAEPTSVRLVQKLPASRFRLNDVEARLNSSGTYRSVAHVAWTQTASAWGSRSGLSAGQLGLDVAGIDGAIYLERGQYLHLGMNLTVASNAGAYTITEMRRVKFNERNYYDHPVYGVIAVVSPGAQAGPTPD